jgi:hypothetical protein
MLNVVQIAASYCIVRTLIEPLLREEAVDGVSESFMSGSLQAG